MSTPYERLDEAMRDLIGAYMQIQDKLETEHGDDEDSIAHGLTEALETALESGLEEHDVNTSAMASMLSNTTDALEQLDPSAFDEEEDEVVSYESNETDDEDIDLDEEDEEDIDED